MKKEGKRGFTPQGGAAVLTDDEQGLRGIVRKLIGRGELESQKSKNNCAA